MSDVAVGLDVHLKNIQVTIINLNCPILGVFFAFALIYRKEYSKKFPRNCVTPKKAVRLKNSADVRPISSDFLFLSVI